MRSRLALLTPVLAALAGPVLAGCTGSAVSGPAHHATSAGAVPGGSPRPSGPVGSAGDPLLETCAQESFTIPPVPQQPQPGDLVIGPLDIGNGERLATASPSGYGEHGSYKVPFILTPGSTATVTIAVPARRQVIIGVPTSPSGGVTAATYHSCSGQAGFFAQGFTFTDGQIRGCVPLDVTIGRDPRVHHVTLSLFAGRCLS